MENSTNSRDEDNLKHETLSSSGWGFLDKGVGFVVHFIIGIVLARLLPPHYFGLIGLGLIVVGLGQTFVNLGLGPSLIQRQNITERHVRVVLTTSGIAGVILAGLVFWSAPLAALVLNSEEVVPVVQALSVVFIFGGLQIPGQALLQKRLEFKYLFYVSIAKSSLYGIVTITLAVIGFGVWSLVIGSILNSFVSFVGCYSFTRHSFKPLFSRREFMDLAWFGSGMTLSGLFNYFAKQGDYFMIGRILGTEALGLYTKAYSLMVQPTKQFVNVLSAVLFPAASRIQTDAARLRNLFLKSMRIIGFVTIPLCLLIIIVAPELIVGLYGENWAGTILPLQILAAFGMFRAMYNAAASFLRAKGWVYRILFSQMIYGLSVLLSVWMGASWFGLAGASWGVGISIFVMWGLMMEFNSRAMEVSRRRILQTLLPGSVIAIVMGIPLLVVKYLLVRVTNHDLLLLVLLTAVSLLFVLAGILLLPQRSLAHLPAEILELIRGYLPGRVRKIFNKVLIYLK